MAGCRAAIRSTCSTCWPGPWAGGAGVGDQASALLGLAHMPQLWPLPHAREPMRAPLTRSTTAESIQWPAEPLRDSPPDFGIQLNVKASTCDGRKSQAGYKSDLRSEEHTSELQ